MIRVVGGHTFDDTELAYVGPIITDSFLGHDKYYFQVALRGGPRFRIEGSQASVGFARTRMVTIMKGAQITL